MAKLVYDKEGRLLFTKQMKKEYTILMPMMLPYHFTLMQRLFQKQGYKMELLTTTHHAIVDEGLESVHNDTCYPALLTIGQLLDAVKSGKYDQNKVALIMSQTGGGCRASNYIYLLRKALKKNGFDHIPVVSFAISNMEKNPGFKITFPTLLKIGCAITYADLLMNLANQTRPYEVVPGETDRLVLKWMDALIEESMHMLHIRETLFRIADDFAQIPVNRVPKVKVGVVGEIYVKFAPLGNNNLEELLKSEGCEVVVPGLLDFALYSCESAIVDWEILGIKKNKARVFKLVRSLAERMHNHMIDAIARVPGTHLPSRFPHMKELVKGYLSTGNKMGEGWLLTAEMLSLIEEGINNIVCTQPFGCLPNHIAGKGMIREIRRNNKDANIVPIDYDPSATKTNQDNRIKLMLALAREQMEGSNQIVPETAADSELPEAAATVVKEKNV